MTENEIVETAIQGHASTRDAIRWAMRQEREACAALCSQVAAGRDAEAIEEAIRARGEVALRQAIAEAEKMVDEPTKIFGPDLENILNRAGFYKKREWVGFTHEELAWLNEALNLGGRFAVIEAIEAKLKEKNS